MQSFKTIQIPRQVRGKPGAWDPSICLDWGRRFLAFLRSAITSQSSDSHRSVWRVRFSPSDGVIVSPLDEGGVDEVEAGEDRVGFLPRWYMEELGVGVAPPGQANGGGALPRVPESDGNDGGRAANDADQASDVARTAVPAGWKI